METDVHRLDELSQVAEEAGWDGVFLPDCISIETETIPAMPFYDPWVALALIAAHTKTIRLGTLLTAIPRRRPWKLARETGTLDHVSNGRVILSIGLGVPQDDGGFYKVGEPEDLKIRAELMDEGLEVLAGMWSAKPFSFAGRHYQVHRMTMLPPPVQKPRIPVWVVGVWPKPKSMNRVIRWDGVIVQKYKGSPNDVAKPEDTRAVREWVDKNRAAKGPFDLVVGCATGARPNLKTLRQHTEAGATWWIEMMWDKHTKVRERLRQGPPRE